MSHVLDFKNWVRVYEHQTTKVGHKLMEQESSFDAQSIADAKSRLKVGTSVTDGFNINIGGGKSKFFKDGSILMWDGSRGLIYGPTYSTVLSDDEAVLKKAEELAKNSPYELNYIQSDPEIVKNMLYTGDAVIDKIPFFNSAFLASNLPSFVKQAAIPQPTIKSKADLQTLIKTKYKSNMSTYVSAMDAIASAFSLS